MFTSSAEVFRTRQAVSDLHDVVRFHREAVERLGRSGAESAVIADVVSAGNLVPALDTRAFVSILQAAAMPDDDFNGFVVGTALLLLDRLQDGAGSDDLYWNYEAFRDHYRLADPPVRAALMNGFRTAELRGRVRLPEHPRPADCLSRHLDDILDTLRADRQEALAEIIESDPSPTLAGQLWSEASREDMAWTTCAAFRYLYERPLSMIPDSSDEVMLIPWL